MDSPLSRFINCFSILMIHRNKSVPVFIFVICFGTFTGFWFVLFKGGLSARSITSLQDVNVLDVGLKHLLCFEVCLWKKDLKDLTKAHFVHTFVVSWKCHKYQNYHRLKGFSAGTRLRFIGRTFSRRWNSVLKTLCLLVHHLDKTTSITWYHSAVW